MPYTTIRLTLKNYIQLRMDPHLEKINKKIVKWKLISAVSSVVIGVALFNHDENGSKLSELTKYCMLLIGGIYFFKAMFKFKSLWVKKAKFLRRY